MIEGCFPFEPSGLNSSLMMTWFGKCLINNLIFG